jgi:hypothetical protein
LGRTHYLTDVFQSFPQAVQKTAIETESAPRPVPYSP